MRTARRPTATRRHARQQWRRFAKGLAAGVARPTVGAGALTASGSWSRRSSRMKRSSPEGRERRASASSGICCLARARSSRSSSWRSSRSGIPHRSSAVAVAAAAAAAAAGHWLPSRAARRSRSTCGVSNPRPAICGPLYGECSAAMTTAHAGPRRVRDVMAITKMRFSGPRHQSCFGRPISVSRPRLGSSGS